MIHSTWSDLMNSTRGRLCARWPAAIALALLADLAPSFAQDPPTSSPAPRASFRLIASEVEIDEGQIVEIDLLDKEYWDPVTREDLEIEADLSPVEWDLDDPFVDEPEAYGLYHLRHRFNESRGAPYRVKATHQGATREVAIQVNNVLPEILHVYVTPDPESGEPVLFHAVAKDPGYFDELRYSWDFGDGSSASGRSAVHTYAREGVYAVTLVVEDEAGAAQLSDGQQRRFTIHVRSDPETPEANTLFVTGDVGSFSSPIEDVMIVGSTGNPMNPAAGGPCQIRLEMRTGREDMSLTLTARLDPGLAPGRYTLGSTREWDGMHRDDKAAQGTFFADFAPPRSLAGRMFGGRRVGGPFWSDGGRVVITRFDSGVLEMDFDATLTENIPGEYDPRTVRVRGALSTTVRGAPDLEAGAGAFDLESAIGGLFQAGQGPDFGVKAYLCGGGEPADFRIVASNPGPNAINAPYEDNVISVEFSQAVDPESLVDHDTLLEKLGVVIAGEGEPMPQVGTWVVSPQNPKVVQYVPAARLLPGAVHCVYVNGGEEGVRSFGGNVLSGSSLPAPTANMARACPRPGADRLGFAFATRPELQSAWVDVYQASLAGPHAELLPNHNAVARVYTWWQDAMKGIHPDAQVREFPANVFAVQDRRAMRAAGGAATGPVATVIKRPDRYTREERRNLDHTIEFVTHEYRGRTTEIFAVVQMKDRDGQVVEPVFPGEISQLGVLERDEQDLYLYFTRVEGSCAAGQTREQCGWGGSWEEERVAMMGGYAYQIAVDAWDYIPTDDPRGVGAPGTVRVETTLICPGGYTQGVCPGATPESTDSRLRALAVRIRDAYKEGPDYDPRVAATVAFVPPGLLPDPEGEPVWAQRWTFPDPPVLLVQVDRFNSVAVISWLIEALLEGEGCRFAGASSCDQTPVQGLHATWPRPDHVGNRHFVEGNGSGSRLVPLLSAGVEFDEYNQTDFHISAWNWARLYDVIRKRHEAANGTAPGN